MKNFTKKIFYFSIPLLFLYLPLVLILKRTGENFTSIDSVINSDKKYLIGYAYNENNYKYLKWKTIKEIERKEILTLGSSRVLQFRKNMFNSSFYNAGYSISSISDFLPFLKSIPENKYPKILIIGLDQWMFNKNWDDLSNNRKTSYWENSFALKPSGATLKSMCKDIWKGKYSFSLLFNENINSDDIFKFGLNAVLNNKGFRNDGSNSPGNQVDLLLNHDPLAHDYKFLDTFSRIKKGNRRFEYGKDLNVDALKKLNEFLSFCSENEIFVIGFLPPFANKVNEKMIETEEYSYIDQIYPKVSQLFAKYNCELWDFTSLKKIDSGDDETIDGFHAGELTHIKMLLHMIHSNSKLKNYTNIDKLKNDMLKRKNNFIVYDY